MFDSDEYWGKRLTVYEKQAETELALDVSAEEARALHRVIRAMHDGHCPKCGRIHPSDMMVRWWYANGSTTPSGPSDEGSRVWQCPSCFFKVTENEAEAALKAFQPHLSKSVQIFERWRESAM